MENTVYKMMLNNLGDYLKSVDSTDPDKISVFDMSSVLSIALCKSKEEIALDIALNNIKNEN